MKDSLKKETKVFFTTSTGSGGQRRDRKKTGVKLLHVPTGTKVHIDNRTSQAQNKKIAFAVLSAKLKQLRKRRKKRVPTEPPRWVEEKRIKSKKIHSRQKKLRSKPETS